MREVVIFDTQSLLMQAAATRFVEIAAAVISQNGRFSVALAGGSTPRGLYTLLAAPPFAQQVDWSRVAVFWGDERCVSPDHADSNYRMARETLLEAVPILAEKIHRMRGELPPAEAAALYEQSLCTYFDDPTGDLPCRTTFDLVLLGMGADGHTASLFPGSSIPTDSTQLVIADHVKKLEAWRISLTPASINAAANVLFLVTGQDKAEALQQVLYGPYRPELLPAQYIRPINGRLQWFVDSTAAPAETRYNQI